MIYYEQIAILGYKMETKINEDYVHDHDIDKFFGLIGFAFILFGAAISLFDLMFSPILSGIAGLLFILSGGVCLMLATGGFLKYLDEKFFNEM